MPPPACSGSLASAALLVPFAALAACIGDPAGSVMGDAPCLLHETGYREILFPQSELRLLVLLDSAHAPPSDTESRIQAVSEALRTGDLDADGRTDFDPVGFESVIRTVSFDEALWPAVERELAVDSLTGRPRVLVLLVTLGDLHEHQVSELFWNADESSSAITFAALAGFVPDVEGTRTRRWAFHASPSSPEWDRLLLDAGVQLSDRTNPLCLPGAPARLADGGLPCTYWERLPDASPESCDDFPGRDAADPRDPRRCRLRQLLPVDGLVPEGPGWYTDDFSAHHELLCGASATLYLAPGTEPIPGSSIHIQCLDRGGACVE